MEAYLDNNATTLPLVEVREEVSRRLADCYANPSSKHGPGRAARKVLEDARAEIAAAINAPNPSEIIFTGSATESIALAMRCAASTTERIVAGAADHVAVTGSARSCAKAYSLDAHIIRVDEDGGVSFGDLERAIASSRSLVCLTAVNNETGVIADLPAAVRICRRFGALTHVDGAQAFGRIPIDVQAMGCDFLSLSPHKFHGPKGVGVLYLRGDAPRQAIVPGHQEFGVRGGTENVPVIAGAAVAVREAAVAFGGLDLVERLRDRLEAGILGGIPGTRVNGAGSRRVANTSNIYFPGRSASDLVDALSRRNVFVSAAAACSTGGAPSHVLKAMGFDDARADGSVRFSLSRFTTQAEVDFAVGEVMRVYSRTMQQANPPSLAIG